MVCLQDIIETDFSKFSVNLTVPVGPDPSEPSEDAAARAAEWPNVGRGVFIVRIIIGDASLSELAAIDADA